jgi:mono/diheme cytochrome c family protein
MKTTLYASMSVIFVAVASLVAIEFAAPRLDWSATAKPGPLERTLAQYLVVRWIKTNSSSESNPLAATPESLRLGREDFEAHCASCHGLDGSGRNQFEADFYPPVSKLAGRLRQLSDAEIYFIIAHGIRLSGMPGFAARHRPEEIWRTVLWVRHLDRLSPQEKAAIEARMSDKTKEHEDVMREW